MEGGLFPDVVAPAFRNAYNRQIGGLVSMSVLATFKSKDIPSRNSCTPAAMTGAGFGGPDPEEERDPPPPPTPITFPTHPAYKGQPWTDTTPTHDFHSLFSRIVKPTDISDHHVNALNITILPECPIEQLVDTNFEKTTWIPSLDGPDLVKSWSEALQTDPLEARKRKDFDDRLAELRIENGLAFQTLSRKMPLGPRPPRIAYMRKFWEGLECMSQYWDCSLDQHYVTQETDDEAAKKCKRQRLWSGSKSSSPEGHDNAISTTKIGRTWPILESTESKFDILTVNPIQDETSETKYASMSALPNGSGEHINELKPEPESATPGAKPEMRYKGRRTSTGRSMPDQFRVDTVKAFIEGTIWPFKASLATPRTMPMVHFGRLNLPVRQTAAVYNMPKDRLKARQGWLQGPILAVQVRPETDFEVESAQQTEEMARLDLVRELGALLQLGQERQREGKTEIKPGEGKWWTSKPRWGGGPGGEVENETGNSDVVALAEESLDANKENNGKTSRKPSRNDKRRTPAVLWKELKCGKGYWDPKVDYTAIGTDPDSENDELFMISSLNHHISIVKMTVHSAYFEYITSNARPSSIPQDSQWASPKLRRTQWFDLFDLDQRVQAFRALWGVMAYLTRPNDRAAEAKEDSEETTRQKST